MQSSDLIALRARRIEPGVYAFEATVQIDGKPVAFEVKPADLTSYSEFQKTAAIATGKLYVHPDVNDALPGHTDQVWQNIVRALLRGGTTPLPN